MEGEKTTPTATLHNVSSKRLRVKQSTDHPQGQSHSSHSVPTCAFAYAPILLGNSLRLWASPEGHSQGISSASVFFITLSYPASAVLHWRVVGQFHLLSPSLRMFYIFHSGVFQHESLLGNTPTGRRTEINKWDKSWVENCRGFIASEAGNEESRICSIGRRHIRAEDEK